MKKTIAISILSIMLYNIAGYYVVFKVLHVQVKNHVWKLQKNSLPSTNLLQFTASVSTSDEFEWVKENEFRYKGSLYDIVRMSAGASGVIWHCVNDIQEDYLLQQLRQQVVAHNGQPAQNAKVLAKCMVKDYVVEWRVPYRIYLESRGVVFACHTRYDFIHPASEVPPPEDRYILL